MKITDLTNIIRPAGNLSNIQSVWALDFRFLEYYQLCSWSRKPKP